MRNFVICTAAVLGMAFVGSASVEAGHCNSNRNSGRYSQYGWRTNNYSNFNRSYNRGYNSNYNSNRYGNYNNVYRSTPSYHNTSHLDYHGPSLQRHGYHLDVVPGHYDVHRSGHYDF
jgi:hypothetical protein